MIYLLKTERNFACIALCIAHALHIIDPNIVLLSALLTHYTVICNTSCYILHMRISCLGPDMLGRIEL